MVANGELGCRMSWVLFFDGDCGVCSSSVRWVVRRDKKKCLFFAPLQGALGTELGLSHHADPLGGTMVLRNQDTEELYLKSEGVIQLLVVLGGVWKLAKVFRVIPRSWRDAMYGAFAQRRHWVSGKVCDLPVSELMDRLLK